MAEIICNPLMRKMQSDLNHVLSNESSDINHRLDPRLSKHIVITPSRHVRTRLYFTSESHIHCMINILRYGGLFGVRLAGCIASVLVYCTVYNVYTCIHVCTWSQDNPEAQSNGWMKLSATPDLNFLSQIVLMLFEDETEPLDSPCRYYINLHIGSGVKARKLSMINSALFIGEEMHSPSFVKRLPADTNILQSTLGVRKVSSSPTMHSVTQPLSVDTLHQRNTSKSIRVIPKSSVLPKSSPESPEKMSITYESLQTMGESGIYIYIYT